MAELQRQLQRETDEKLDIFLRYTYLRLLVTAREAFAPLLGTHADEVVSIPDATMGANTVLRNLDLEEGDVVLYLKTLP